MGCGSFCPGRTSLWHVLPKLISAFSVLLYTLCVLDNDISLLKIYSYWSSILGVWLQFWRWTIALIGCWRCLSSCGLFSPWRNWRISVMNHSRTYCVCVCVCEREVEMVLIKRMSFSLGHQHRMLTSLEASLDLHWGACWVVCRSKRLCSIWACIAVLCWLYSGGRECAEGWGVLSLMGLVHYSTFCHMGVKC